MTIENPPLKEHGFVVGRFVTAVADTLDDEDRYPDLRAIQGKIRFTPLQSVHLYAGEHPATVVRQPITMDLDEQGYLRDVESQNYGGPTGLYLAVGVYRVDPIFESVTGVSRFTIEVTAEHTKEAPLNLTLAAPIETPPGFTEVVRIGDRIRAEDAAEAAEGHAGTALVYRDEAAQSAATAESHADRAETARDETLSNAIEVDTSVGTRVTVGGVMVHGDTGSRRMDNEIEGLTSGSVSIKRENSLVEIIVNDLMVEATETSWHELPDFLPPGFRPSRKTYFTMAARNSDYTEGPFRVDSSGTVYIYEMRSSDTKASVSVVYTTTNSWPTTLPGTPA